MGKQSMQRVFVVKGLTAAGWLMGAGMLISPNVAFATPGTHPALMSTSDTRGSSVILAYRQAVGPLTGRFLSYNANFSSTGGILSAQFGAHVLQLQESRDTNTLYGAAATGAAVWSIPVTQRFDNGVPKVGLIVYAGGAPTAAVSGKRNFLNVPIGIGLGSALSPASWITITPWFEAAPGLDLDTTIVEPDLSQYAPSNADLQDLLNDREAVILSEEELNQIISDSVKVDVAFEMAMRAGLDVTLRMSESWSFNVNSYLTTLGSTFGGQTFVYAGAGLVFHWDDIVPAVLPASRRLEKESCEAIEARFRMCPGGKVSSTQAVSSATSPHGPIESTPTGAGGVSSPPAAISPAPEPERSVSPEPGFEPTPPAPTPIEEVSPQSPAPTPSPAPVETPNGNSPPSTKFPESSTLSPAPGTTALPSVSAPY